VVTRVGTKGERQRSLRRKLFYSAMPTILAFLIVEGLFRIYFLMQTDALNRREYERWLHHPAYASKPWFSGEFAASFMARPKWEEGWSPEGTHLVIPFDYKDRFYTIRDGIRATVGFDPSALPSGRRPRKLFVLGGSTTYCQEVPDDFTWASQLQKRLAAIPETRDIEVVNYGFAAAVSLQEVERLEYEIARNNIPDFCIFLDGMNDAFQAVVNGDPGGTICGAGQTYTSAGLLSTLKSIARMSVAAQTIYISILSSQRRNDPAHTQSEAKVRELAKMSVDIYVLNLLHAQEICDRYRIRMIVFLQPHLYSISGRPWTPHERATADMMTKSHADALRVCYPLLREKLGLLKQRGILTYDISDAFNDNREPIFVEQYHVESTGNRLIAEAILTKVLPVFLDSSSSPETALPLEPDRRAER
jgi:lysophospholipase L1-like esterase